MSFCKIDFKVKCYTYPQQYVRISGGSKALGEWSIHDALLCRTDEQTYPYWVSCSPIYLPRGTEFKLKIVIVDENCNVIRWEKLPDSIDGNRTYTIRYYQILLEITEGVFQMKDTVLLPDTKKFLVD